MDVIYMLQFYKTISTNFLDYVLYNSVYNHYHHLSLLSIHFQKLYIHIYNLNDNIYVPIL